MENQFRRKIHSPDGEERKKYGGYLMTEEEDQMVKEYVSNLGYDKPRDFLVAVARKGSMEKELRNNWKAQQKIRISKICGYIGQIDKGIQIESAKDKIVEEVRMLCQEYSS